MKNKNNNGTIVLALLGAIGLAIAIFGVTWFPSPGAGSRPVAAAVPGEGLGDAIFCQTGQPAMDAPLDIAGVSVSEKQGGYDVHVRTAMPASEVFTNAYSAAVLVTLGNQSGIAQIHADEETIGLEDDFANIIPGTEGNVRIESDGVHFNFPGELKEGAELIVETFHQKSFLDDVTCDTAYSDDPTAPKPGDPTATDTPATATPTPTGDPPGTATGTPTNTPTNTPDPVTATATPTDTPTNTPSPTDDPEATATPTPTPTATPELIKVIVRKFIPDSDLVPLAGWEMRIFDGDVCLGSPIASGVTEQVVGDPTSPYYSLFLPPGVYSVAETLQTGWERVFPGAFCQSFTVSAGSLPTFVALWNRRIRNGDVNEDGVTNSLDTLLVLQFIAGLLPELPNGERADVNGDGMVNAVDTALMLQFEAGFIDSLPIGGE